MPDGGTERGGGVKRESEEDGKMGHMQVSEINAGINRGRVFCCCFVFFLQQISQDGSNS